MLHRLAIACVVITKVPGIGQCVIAGVCRGARQAHLVALIDFKVVTRVDGRRDVVDRNRETIFGLTTVIIAHRQGDNVDAFLLVGVGDLGQALATLLSVAFTVVPTIGQGIKLTTGVCRDAHEGERVTLITALVVTRVDGGCDVVHRDCQVIGGRATIAISDRQQDIVLSVLSPGMGGGAQVNVALWI